MVATNALPKELLLETNFEANHIGIETMIQAISKVKIV